MTLSSCIYDATTGVHGNSRPELLLNRARRSKTVPEEDDEQNEFAEALPADYRGVDDCARCDYLRTAKQMLMTNGVSTTELTRLFIVAASTREGSLPRLFAKRGALTLTIQPSQSVALDHAARTATRA